jgi:4-amino-4-deoxy-L-arabinose transferase-like glycosyltransferase
MDKRSSLWLMVLILLVAAALRLAALGQIPPGLYHDEAYNGLDALKVLDGDLSLYFAANNGREPLFIYLVAATVGLLGRSPFAVRLAAVAPGLLTVAATFALGRALFDRRVGLLGAAILAVTLWHVHLSRVGFRAALLPLFIALFLWQGALAARTGRRRYWLAAGALYALSFYTYLAARFTPVALFLLGVYSISRGPNHVSRFTFHVSRLRWSIPAFLAVLSPLALFTLRHPNLVLARTGQVAIWDPAIHGGDFLGTLLTHTARTLGMFLVRGDRIWRHNVPWRPVFDPLLGFFFLLGLIWALRRWRHDGAAALLVFWTATMSLPTLLAEDAPHFLRGVGVLPLAVLFPALGLDWVLGSREYEVRSREGVSRFTFHVLRFTPLVVLGVALFSTTIAYLGRYAHSDMAGYWFEDGAVALAGQVNRFLGSGWDGERMLHGQPGERVVYVESLLWREWQAIPFLVADSSAVRLLPDDQDWPAVGDGPAAIFVWPYGDWQRVWPALGSPIEIRVQEGALSQGDRDPEPYRTFLAFYVTPVETAPPALARFAGGVELVGVALGPTDGGAQVELQWRATAPLPDDYTVFVHYLRDGERVGQHDAQPAGAHYPTRRWQPGDLVHDEHVIPLDLSPDSARDALRIGLYRVSDGQALDVLDAAGNPAGAFTVLPIREVLR